MNDDPLLAAFDLNLEDEVDATSSNKEFETAESLATKCENFQTDEERQEFFRLIDKESTEKLELNCPALLILAHTAEAKEFRDELEDFLIKNLSHLKSRLVRKACSCALKDYFLPVNDSRCQEYFVLLSSLEETQYHVVEPALDKLFMLANQVFEQNSPLKWEHIKAAFINAFRQSGWIQVAVVLRMLKLPTKAFADDVDFLINYFFETLSQYEIYWRIEQHCGIKTFLEDLRLFIEKIQSKEFWIKFLDFIPRHFFPCPIFLISQALPSKVDKFLDANDLPLARRVFTSINKHHFQKLRHACFFNFFVLFVQIFKLDDVKELESVFLMLPEAVQEQANKLLLAEFSKTLERETNVTEQQVTYTENDIPILLNNIQSEDASLLKSVKALVELMTKVDDVKQAEIVKTIEVAYFDSRGQSYCFEICGYYIDAILNNLESNTTDSLERLFKLLELNVKNPNVVYVIARKINNYSNISIAIYPFLLELITFGELPSKFTDVLKIAHLMAHSFDLDEVTELHLLQQRVREFSNISLLNLAFQNMDTVDALVSDIVQKTESINKKYRNISFALSNWHRKQTRILSLLLIFVGTPELYKCLSKETNEQIRAMCMERVLEENQQYSIKMMCEWLLTFYCIRDPEFYTYWVEQSKELAYKRIGAVASWISSILRSLRVVDNELNRQRLPGFLFKVLPWITAQNFLVNVFSISAFKLLCNWHRQYISDTPSIQFAIEVGDFNVETTGNTRKFVNSVCSDPIFDQLMPEKVDLYVMFYAFPKLTGMPADELIFETKPNNALLEQYGLTDYLKVDFTQPCLFASLNTIVITRPNKVSVEKNVIINNEEEFEIQQKLDTVEMQLKKKQKDDSKQLIVVASLIDKVANLGGLSRTLEIFNGTALVLSYAGVVDKREFQSLSMSSEKHLKIIEVKPEDLLQYLKEIRGKGFSVVAAEQTSRSVFLNKFKFPKKTVLLMGAERLGVPPELIRYVDHCVEIPQLGVTRSLNVHVTASLFVYNYAEQHFLPKC